MHTCPDTGCDWTPPFPVDDEDDWAVLLEVHRAVKLNDALAAS